MSSHELVVECPCGVEIRRPTMSELVTAVQQHAGEIHDMHLDEQQVADMARPA